MDIKATAAQFLPVSGWKQWVGLFIVVVLIVAVAKKIGAQAKVNSTIGAGA